MSKARELANLGNAYSDGALSNRNAIINGGFDVWQRGTPITNSGGGSYFSADRWKGYSGASRTFTQDTTSALEIGFKNCLKAQNGAATSSFYNRIEDVRTFAGKTVTLSYWIKADAAHTPAAAYLAQNFGSGGSATVFTYLSSPSVTTSWQRVVQTVSLPSVEGKTFGSSHFLEVYPFTLSASQTYYITGVQLEVGDTATPFEHRSYGQELALCQRYLYRLNGNSSDQTMIAAGYFYNTAATRHIVHYPVTMRGAASVSANGLDVLRDVANDAAVTFQSTLDASIYSCGLNIGNVEATTVGEGAILRLASSTSAYIEFDAEL